MREQVVDVPPQEVITSDNVVVSVDAVVYYEPTDPQRLIYNVANFILAVTKLAQTNLRNLVGDLQLDQALTSRDAINTSLREILDDATDTWGVRVKRVELQRIDPPADVMSAMHEQMKAERTRRAHGHYRRRRCAKPTSPAPKVSGRRRSCAPRRSSSSRSSKPKAQALAVRELAAAEKFRNIATAEGEAEAIRSVYGAIHDGNPTNDLLAIKYLDALAKIADGRATKIFLPVDTNNVMGSIAGISELFRSTGDPTSPPRTPPPPPALTRRFSCLCHRNRRRSPIAVTQTVGSAARSELDGLAGGELAAGGVDVGAAVPADRGVGAERLEPVAELVRRGRAAVPFGRLARASG